AGRAAAVSYELIAIMMFSAMLLMLLTGQRVFGAIGFVAGLSSLMLWGEGGSELPFSAAMKLLKWYPLLTLPLLIYMGYVLVRAAARRACGRHHRPDGRHLGDERPERGGDGDRRHHRAARAAAARLRQDHGHRGDPGRQHARHPGAAERGAGAVRNDRPPAG